MYKKYYLKLKQESSIKTYEYYYNKWLEIVKEQYRKYRINEGLINEEKYLKNLENIAILKATNEFNSNKSIYEIDFITIDPEIEESQIYLIENTKTFIKWFDNKKENNDGNSSTNINKQKAIFSDSLGRICRRLRKRINIFR